MGGRETTKKNLTSLQKQKITKIILNKKILLKEIIKKIRPKKNKNYHLNIKNN